MNIDNKIKKYCPKCSKWLFLPQRENTQVLQVKPKIYTCAQSKLKHFFMAIKIFIVKNTLNYVLIKCAFIKYCPYNVLLYQGM